jgi:two-component system response regulator PilR (NtrC family)
VLSATHKPLVELVALGRFREDLYYRINVIEIRVPALREHAGDVPELAAAMLQRLSARIGVSPPQISAEAYAALNRYAFPGNVRELENILERAITLSVSGLIDVQDLQLRRASDASAAAADAAAAIASSIDAALSAATALSVPMAGVDSSSALGDQLEHMEREAIIKALEQTRYNKTAAAKLLGMSFRALRYRIKKLGIE